MGAASVKMCIFVNAARSVNKVTKIICLIFFDPNAIWKEML